MRRTPVDLAIVDIGLHGSTNGIELTKAIRAEHPDLPVLVLSMHDESLYADRALRAGARGYLMKREALDSVITAVRTVLSGEIYVSPTMAKRMIADMATCLESRFGSLEAPEPVAGALGAGTTPPAAGATPPTTPAATAKELSAISLAWTVLTGRIKALFGRT